MNHSDMRDRRLRTSSPTWLTFPRIILLALSVYSFPAFPQTGKEFTKEELKKLSLEDLMNIEVFSVSRRAEELITTSSAIQVITAEEIRRSGATTLPDALRLATNLQVAQVSSHGWAITSRGFNGSPTSTGSLANKLLVMIDGRTVYTPLYGGVFWDAQQVLLEDVERIEVISGPGGTLWGANAVNGVINVITKKASETQGIFASVAAGTFLKDHAALRYGGKSGDNLYYRGYIQHFDRGITDSGDSTDSNDQWGMTQGGFRLGYLPTGTDNFTLQGDLYSAKEGDTITNELNGQNLLGTWSHDFSEKSELNARLYFDRTWRRFLSSGLTDEIITYDIDLQHRLLLGRGHELIYGAGYRMLTDKTNMTFSPLQKRMPIYSGFIQDRFQAFREALELTIGVKLEHNVYVGLQILPSGRVSWKLSESALVWGAYSRAVRSPTRFDVDLIVAPNDDFVSEKVNAYEIGHRLKVSEGLLVSASGYYNRYNDLRSINIDSLTPSGFILGNDQEADAWGVELVANLKLLNNWRVKGGYTFHEKRITSNSSTVQETSMEFEALDPRNQFLIHSMLNLTKNLKFDFIGRYVSRLPSTATFDVDSYFTFDTRFAWTLNEFEFSLVGQNLWQAEHVEFGEREIPRSVYGQIAWRLNNKD